jgi:hypothetical protein
MKRIVPASLAVAAALFAARYVLRNWGATKAESRAVLFGDENVPEPASVTTRAVTIDAPAAEVWRWLVQIGQDRGGMYSYEWLENLVGLDIHNTDQIRSEWQDLKPGDKVRLVRPGWLGMPEGYALTVQAVDPGRSLVLQVEPWHAVWSFHVHPLGRYACRLISRGRAPRTEGLARLVDELGDPITLVMTRKMLLGIKQRAEAAVRAGLAAQQPVGARR